MSSNVKTKSQTYSTGLYGSATSGKNGTVYNPTDFESSIVNLATTYIPQYLEQSVNPTYDSAVFQATTNQRNRLAQTSFENNLINPLSERGLTRGSSVNQLSGQFANKLADMENDAMATEDTRVSNTLNNLWAAYQMPYSTMQGISNSANSLYQQGVSNNQNSTGLGSALATGLGMATGGYLGGVQGASLGGQLGTQFGKSL